MIREAGVMNSDELDDPLQKAQRTSLDQRSMCSTSPEL